MSTTTYDLDTLSKLAHASYCEKKNGDKIIADDTFEGAVNALNDDFENNSPFNVIKFETYDDGTQIARRLG
jgi:hypothetical protein